MLQQLAPNCFTFRERLGTDHQLAQLGARGNYHVQVVTPGGTSATSSADVLTVNPPTPPVPTLTGVAPPTGTTLGGTTVNLTGTSFDTATDVFFGSDDVTSFTINSNTSITVSSPSHAAGGVSVTVENLGGTSGGQPYTFVAPPTLTGLAPPTGSTAGGTTVNLTGTSFDTATDVFFGSIDVTSFTINTDTSITVSSPSHAAGGVSVTVENAAARRQASRSHSWRPPTLTGLTPPSGSTAGGTTVSLTGTSFDTATDVFFGSIDVTSFTINSDTSITVSSPAHGAGGVSVTVENAVGTSGSQPYAFVASPTLATVAPTTGPTTGGTTVNLTGTNFTTATDVFFGSDDVTSFAINSDTSITVSSPAHGAGGVSVTVENPGGTSGGQPYTFVPPPALTSLSPTSGPTLGGNPVTLTGTNFTGATEVTFGSDGIQPCGISPCFTVDSDTQITIDNAPPNGPGSVDVSVTTPDGTSGAVSYLYVTPPAPTVTHVSPNEGALAGGNVVTLTGTGFEMSGAPVVTSVTVGTTAITAACAASPTAPCFSVTTATSITIGFMPPGSAGQVNITATTPGGTSATASGNTYTYNASFPSVTEVTPRNGATSGGEAISVLGSGFGLVGQDFVTDVFFGTNDVPESNSYPCPSSSSGCFIVVGPTQLAVYTPSNAAGTVDVTVATPIGTSNPGTGDKYTFVAPGAYTAVTPYRVCDTRPAGPGVAHNECNTGVGSQKTLGPGGSVTAQITSSVAGQVPTGAQAVVVNVTAIDHSTTSTYVTAYPYLGTRPLASNINLSGGKVEANLVIVQLGSGGAITLFNSVGSTDVIVDVEGYFMAPGGGTAGEFHSIPPLRICDTRANKNTECAAAVNDPLLAGHWRDVVLAGLPPGAPVGSPSIPANADAAAAVFNLTAVGGTAPTFLSVAPAGTNHTCPASAPTFSNVNPAAGTALPNRVLSKLGPNQDVCIFSAAGSINVIVDVNGWFGSSTAPAGVLFYSIPPTRVCDTRVASCSVPPGPLGLTGNESDPVAIAGTSAVPADNLHSTAPVAVVANVTGIAGTATTFFTLYPSDATKPEASDLNPAVGQVIANLAIVQIATTGTNEGDVSLYNAAGDINAILDVAGWFQ